MAFVNNSSNYKFMIKIILKTIPQTVHRQGAPNKTPDNRSRQKEQLPLPNCSISLSPEQSTLEILSPRNMPICARCGRVPVQPK